MSENICRLPEAWASCSVMNSIGEGIQDLNYLLRCNEPWEDGLWCDTYDGLNLSEEDWWAVNWPVLQGFNVVQFRQGPMTDSGGWWRSLWIEYQTAPDQPWKKAKNLHIWPEYNFSDQRGDRMPYEGYNLVFDRVKARGIRLIGQPGGLAQHTKVSQIAVYDHDLSYWTPPPIDQPPVPRLLRWLSPGEIFKIFQRFYPVSDILFTLIIGRLNLIFFLNEGEYLAWKKLSRFSADPTDFWRRVYDREGASRWYALTTRLMDQSRQERRGLTGVREDGLAQIVAPLIVDGQVLGMVRNTSLVCVQPFDIEQQRQYALSLGLDPDLYFSELAKIPQVSPEKLEAIGAFLEVIAKTLAELVIRNEMLAGTRNQDILPLKISPDEIIHRSVQYMRDHIEQPLSVQALAGQAGLSPAHYSRLFQNEIGCSPGQYLINLRLERAGFLLRHSRSSLSEICGAVGYESLPSFARLFKQRLGVTPSQYREKNQE
jgi:AraC-like DNA-binding protein